jgi:hypothetical protein
MKPGWKEQFDNEIVMYDKLKSLQGSVISVFCGKAVVEDGTRAIVPSDVAGTPLALVPPSECNPGGRGKDIGDGDKSYSQVGLGAI